MVRKRTLAYGGIAAASLVAGTVARVVSERRSTPALSAETVETLGDAELRRYPATVAVETVAPSEHRAFGRLVRYASGNNDAETGLSALPTVVSEGERPPAASGSESADDAVRMAFYLPETYDVESTPRPSDPNVRVVERPARTLAVTPVPRWSVGNRVERARERLLSNLRGESRDIDVVGDPFVLRYDGPGASSSLRASEVAVEVRRVSATGAADG
ncbi:SOUL heme-binding protein [Halopelagius inordinatus]|uniref:SOUL heme-binding protein n=1 Tax=Halopelagius inordinatus TaxID=553467 RepID=A0A1I2NJ83_9EURY|nr:heme-binding protein [Halopelagius inordinatus]SFG03954.1 SOUL heme-binding protein [Halopelagius inordinatus]